jgi:hypothetical protein
MRVALNLELHNLDGSIDRRPNVVVTIVQGLFEFDGRRYRTKQDTLVEQTPEGPQRSWVVCEERPSKRSKVPNY